MRIPAASLSVVLSLTLSPLHAASADEPVSGGSRDGTILWHRNYVDAIYTSTGLCGPSATATAGTYWMAPIGVEAVPTDGDGTPDWTYSGGTQWFVDASRNGEVIAAIDFHNADSTARIYEWRPDSSTPLWSYVVHPCRSLTYQGWATRKPIQVSDDGSTIAAAIVMYRPEGQRGRLLAFDPGTGTPAVDYDFPGGNVVATAVSENGAYIAMAGWPTLYVYDRVANSLRWSGSIGSGNDALAISGDGNYIAWGWTTFNLRAWNGSSYASVWSTNPPGDNYVGQCAFSNAGNRLALSWDNGNTTPNVTWLEMYELPSLALLWAYDFQPARGSKLRDSVDIPSQMLFSPAGSRLAVGAWGGTFPEVHVFETDSPVPLFTLDTPGSVFDIDIVDGPLGQSVVVACGKHVHAGTGGRGGDFYAIEIPPDPSGVDNQSSPPQVSSIHSVSPNPFRSDLSITFQSVQVHPVQLTVHDMQGRLLRRLLTSEDRGGLHSLTWDGRDSYGREMPAGIYLLRLDSGTRAECRKVIRIE